MLTKIYIMSRWHLLNISQLPSPCCLIFKIFLLKLKGLFMFQRTHLFPILPPHPPNHPPIDWVWHLGNTPHPLIVSPPWKDKCKCYSSIIFLLTCSYILYLPRTFLNSGFQSKFMAENKTNNFLQLFAWTMFFFPPWLLWFSLLS